jgi:hypothetical protein
VGVGQWRDGGRPSSSPPLDARSGTPSQKRTEKPAGSIWRPRLGIKSECLHDLRLRRAWESAIAEASSRWNAASAKMLTLDTSARRPAMASPTRRSSPQAQQGPSRGKSFIGAMLIASAIALALIVYPASSQTTGSSTRAESPPAQPQQQTSQPQTPQSQQQTSPQGGTGPLETSSGGAPAASPQGETPPGMQSAPGGSGAKDPKPD